MLIKKILVATDGSDCAKKAIELAADLAKENNAELGVLFVAKNKSEDVESVLGAARTFLADKDLKTVFLSEVDHPHRGILKVAEGQKSDLIVVGSRGTSGFSEILLGSVSTRVAQLAKVPVLVAR